MPVISVQEHLSQPHPPPQFLICGLLPYQGKLIIAGQPKVGKSFLLLEMAICLTSGTPFLGVFPIRNQVKVTLLQVELPTDILTNRLIAASKIARDGALDRFYLLQTRGLRLNKESDLLQLKQELAPIHPQVLLLDPLFMLYTGSYQFLDEVAEFFNNLDNLSSSLSLATVVVHHLRKPMRDRYGRIVEQSALDILGSIAFRGGVDASIILQGHPDKLEIQFDLRHLPPTDPMIVSFSTKAPFFRPVKVPPLLTIISLLSDRVPKTRSWIANHSKVHHREVSEILGMLEDLRVVERDQNAYRLCW